jgi:hypothetical protein
MDTPVIFLAFANDKDSYLDKLKEESRRLNAALSDVDRKQYIKLLREESAQIEDIFKICTDYKDQLAIFHYAGHAGGTHLQLEGGSGDARGLAALLGEQENVKLVFLNGCSTKDQVKLLLDAGVPAVIATSVPIEDDKAVILSRQFYEALANRRTIKQAFQLAVAHLTTKYGDSVDVSMRSADWEGGGSTDAKVDMPWGLYTHPDHTDALDWKLPYFRPIGLSKDMIQYIGGSFTANRYIVLALDEMCKYNPDIYHEMVEKRGEKEIKKDSSKYPWLIIENFPWPIGSQIRLLLLYDKPNVERLQHLVSTYVLTGQLLYYILLSDLWEKSQAEDGRVWSHTVLSKAEFAAFDFFKHIPELFKRIDEDGLPFVPEFELLVQQLEDESSTVCKAHAHLEQLREQLLSDNPPSADLDKLCLKTEQATSIILRAAAFLARYRMLTVRNILINKPRFEELVYDLEMGPLNATEGSGLNLYRDKTHRRKENYADSSSIVLVSNEDQLDTSLNLSPLVMDKNTFVHMKKSESTDQDRLAHVFLMGWEEKDRLYYIAVEHSFFHSLNAASDQVHTDMTQDDFSEGRNIPEDDFGADLDDEFGDVFGLDESTEQKDEQKVFQMLYDQYQKLKIELAS